MAKAAVISDKETALLFKTSGVDAYSFKQETEVKRLFHQVLEKGYGLIFLDEKVFLILEEELKEIEGRATPSVLVIPSAQENLGISNQYIERKVQKAVGMKL